MKPLKPFIFVVVLVLIGATAGVLAHAKANQHLGAPGVQTLPLAGSKNLAVILPADGPGYTSESREQASIVTNALPPDTSFGQRLYTCTNGFQAMVNVVLMGTSRTSIHKPQICLTGQGWAIDDSSSREVVIPMTAPVPYDLHVMLLVATRSVQYQGQTVKQRGLYAYWFVAADRLTARHSQRMLWMAYDVVFKNILDRWAYISYFTLTSEGQEDAAFSQMKNLIIATVPRFQLVPEATK